MLHIELECQGMDVSLLDRWYKKDSNAVPPISILQPISSILKNFNNKVIKFSLKVNKKAITKFIRNLENTEAAAGGPSYMVGHHGEDAEIVQEGRAVPVQCRKIR